MVGQRAAMGSYVRANPGREWRTSSESSQPAIPGGAPRRACAAACGGVVLIALLVLGRWRAGSEPSTMHRMTLPWAPTTLDDTLGPKHSHGRNAMPAYVINLDRDTERLAYFNKMAKAAKFSATRFPGVNKDELDLEALADEGMMSRQLYEQLMNGTGGFAPISYHAIPGVNCIGTLACALAHITLWEKIAAQPGDSPVLIFEDDGVVPPDFLIKLNTAMRHAPPDWDRISLCSDPNDYGPPWRRNELGHSKDRGHNYNDYFWANDDAIGPSQGYIVRPSGARKLVSFMLPIHNFFTSDENLRRGLGRHKQYWTREVLVKRGKFKSTREN